jgi:predicted phosphoribosyltransferase
MSLVKNLFSAGTTNTEPNRNDFGIVDDGVRTGSSAGANIKFGPRATRLDTMASKEIEEEERAPYLHVNISNF